MVMTIQQWTLTGLDSGQKHLQKQHPANTGDTSESANSLPWSSTEGHTPPTGPTHCTSHRVLLECLDNKGDEPLLCHPLSTPLSLASLCACPLIISCGTALWAHVEGGVLLGVWDKYFLLGLLSFNFVSISLSQVTL